MTTLQEQIQLLQQSLLENFQVLRSENDEIFSRLEKIEEMLVKPTSNEKNTVTESLRNKEYKEIQINKEKKSSVKNIKSQKQKKERRRESSSKTKVKEIHEDNEGNNNEEEPFEDEDVNIYDELSIDLKTGVEDDKIEENVYEDDGKRHDVEMKIIPENIFEGFCFRPITGWKNSVGGFEISREIVQFINKMVNRIHKLDFMYRVSQKKGGIRKLSPK